MLFLHPFLREMKSTTKHFSFVILGIMLGGVMLISCKPKNQTQPLVTEPVAKDTISEESEISPEAAQAGFCRIKDSIPDIVIDMRYYGTHNFVGRRIDGYEAPVPMLTKEATSALRKVADELRSKGYRLKIYDAYRPQCAVDHFLRWAQDPADTLMKSEFYPDIDKPDIFRRGFVARKSSHTRGSAVDMTIVHAKTGEDVNMGGTFDFFGDSSHADYEGVTAEQHQNRVLLREVMMKYGFKPVRGEWWHFMLLNEPYSDTYFTFPVK